MFGLLIASIFPFRYQSSNSYVTNVFKKNDHIGTIEKRSEIHWKKDTYVPKVFKKTIHKPM